MDIQIDSREKAKAIQKIISTFDRRGVNWFVSKLPVGDYISLDELAKLCYPRRGVGIYACELQRRTKVFPASDNGEYFLGRPGDYMAVRLDDFTDIYVIQREIFLQTYEADMGI